MSTTPDDLDEFIGDQWRDPAFRDAYVMAVIWDAQRRIYNGSGDGWQELYDRGAAPVVERFAVVLQQWLAEVAA